MLWRLLILAAAYVVSTCGYLFGHASPFISQFFLPFPFFGDLVLESCMTACRVGSCAAGLYTPQDHIEILDERNFARLVFDSERVWVVEFYAQWWYVLLYVAEPCIFKLAICTLSGRQQQTQLLSRWRMDNIVPVRSGHCQHFAPIYKAFGASVAGMD
jgi:hypothetical protein